MTCGTCLYGFCLPILSLREKQSTSPPILQYLKKNGQYLDSEIAVATGIPLRQVRASLTALTLQGEITQCRVTRFNDGKPVEGILCRIAGSIPPAAPGRKPGAKV